MISAGSTDLFPVQLAEYRLSSSSRSRRVSGLSNEVRLDCMEEIQVVGLGLTQLEKVHTGLGPILEEKIHSYISLSCFYHDRHYEIFVCFRSCHRLKHETLVTSTSFDQSEWGILILAANESHPNIVQNVSQSRTGNAMRCRHSLHWMKEGQLNINELYLRLDRGPQYWKYAKRNFWKLFCFNMNVWISSRMNAGI